MVVAYDGTDFHGFAENDGVRTVGGVLRSALESVLGHPVELTCAGRTDTGVHARGQVVSVRWSDDRAAVDPDRLRRSVDPDRLRRPVDPDRLRRSLISMLGPEVVVRSIEPAADGFDARFSAIGRTYRYQVWNHVDPDPFRDRTAWWVAEPLHMDTMQAAAEVLLGEHDFATFCRRPRTGPPRRDTPGESPGERAGSAAGESDGTAVSLVRRVERVRWSRPEPDDGAPAGSPSGLVRFEISATAFCHQMVRSIVGLLVEVGRGRRTVADVAAALEARDRSYLPTLAPPRGLTLWAVHYE